MDPNPSPPDHPAHWPDLRLLIKGLRARAGGRRPVRDPRPRPRATGSDISWT